MLSHVSQVATKKKLNITNERVVVNAFFYEQGSVLRGDAEGFCDRFEVEISMETLEPEAEIATLVRLARQMCFTDKALTGPTLVQVTQKINGVIKQI